jgi:lipoyl(octanoyl) transferase
MSIDASSSQPHVWVVRAGVIPYERARLAQRRLEEARIAQEVPDVLLLLEHPPVYTRGRRSTPDELPMGEEWYRAKGIEIRDTDRGGRVTYHGPGQLVGYPIVSLQPYGNDVHEYVRRLEQLIISALADWGVEAMVIDGLTGVWTPQGRKIGSIGVHVSRAVTTHGFAINVDNDLEPFEWIVPCGIESCLMSSLARELGAGQDLDAFETTVSERFSEVYDRAMVQVGLDELVERVPGLPALAEPVTALR